MRSLLQLGLAVALALVVAPGGSARPVEPAPVPSLEPAKTAAEWNRLVAKRPLRAAAAAECRPLRAVFYAASDWLRLATKLAANRSSCAEYYVSIPPIVADKTQPRRDQAWRIRALGPNFHAMAEIHFTTWNRWVSSTGSTWHAAGVTARERMAAAGYDVAQGDTWVLNEMSSAVRRGDGNARANIREFLRGLYEGDGSRPTRGAVFVIGVGQRTPDLSVYQNTLQNWLSDSAFWTDMATYVSDWSQEVYGDVRSFAVPGAEMSVRRDYLNDYLQHKAVLTGVGPDTIEPARAFLRDSYSPLGNAAWQRDAGYGWTMVPVEQMAGYVSAQVDALRYFSATTGQARDHWGFAWAPRNSTGMSAGDFASQTSGLLDRLAGGIRDSGEAADAACGPPGQNLWCVGDVEGAIHNEAWKSFRGWTQAVLRFATPTQAITAGTVSATSVSLVTSSGAAVTNQAPLALTLSSSSPQGQFSTSPTGPWTNTLALTLAPGTASVGFHYQDTRAGTHVLTASAANASSATQTVTVAPAAAARVAVTPASGEVRVRGQRRFAATAADAYGNAVNASFGWRVTPTTLGTIRGSGSTATFTAARLVRGGSVVATAGSIAGSARVTVTRAQLRIGSIQYRKVRNGLRVTVTAIDGARRPVPKAAVSVLVKRDGRRHFTGRAATGPSGRTFYRVPTRGGGCFVATVRKVSAAGFAWNGRTPRNRFCVS